MILPHQRSETEKDRLLFGSKNQKIMNGAFKERAKSKHEEADLHLAFCKWVKLTYPKDQYIRHEREKQRSPFLQNLFKIYNSDLDKMPDFELLEPVKEIYIPGWDKCTYYYHRLYIEFKKPGTTLTLRDGKTIKPAYADQYRRHIRFWEQNSPAYFCSSLDDAIAIFNAYKIGSPLPMQVFTLTDAKD